MSPADRDVLIVRYLDGTAGSEEVAALNDLLKTDADARALLREASYQAITLSDLSQGPALRAPRRPAPETRWNPRLLAAAAAVLIAAGLGFIALFGTPAQSLLLVRVTGAVTWTPVGGLPQTELEPGTSLGPGIVMLEGAQSSAELSFKNGSSILLYGDSEVTIPGSDRAPLLLRRGSVTVEARLRPERAPMVVRTPTADVAVVDTCFSLTAGPARTTVAVGTGTVGLRRLVDGASAEIPAGRVAVATLDATETIESRPAPVPAPRWNQTFDRAPAGWQGEWVPADASGPGRMKNVLDVSHRRKDGSVVSAHVVSVRDPSALTTIRPDSTLRLRWRIHTPFAAPLVLLSVGHPDGKFAGNFQTLLKPEACPPDAHGWRSTSLAVSSLEGRFPEGAALPPIGRVTLVFIACYNPAAGLEVAEVALE